MIYIGLGTNLGDRYYNLERARSLIAAHHEIEIVTESSIVETDPVDFLEQPCFLNQVIAIYTGLPAKELLDALQRIEKEMGKKVIIPRGPRIIDLDILLYHDHIYNTGNLVLPHARIVERDFILKHLVELDDSLRDPVSGILYKEVLHGYNKKHK